MSIIIAAFNRANFIEKTLRSTSNQSLNDIEIIVIDDASTDDTLEVAKKAAQRDNRIKIIELDRNTGPSAARNEGIKIATGNYIAIVDADDLCMPNRLERQIQFLQTTGIDLCGSWLEEFGKGIPRITRWPHTEEALRTSLLFQNSICHPTVMARREVFEKYRYREEYRLAEDYDLFVRVMSEFRIANVPEVLLRYRRHAQQATQAQRAPMEAITQKIRIEALAANGVESTQEERRLHNLIRAPHSINSLDDLMGIETWLSKLNRLHARPEAKQVIASQWVRACVRAAPLGTRMLRAYRASAFRGTLRTELDLSALAAMKLDYSSKGFAVLRRLGLST